ncbi:sulfotransferase [Alteromonas sp. M12]|uniref:sulfotransferase n=1 Tax=Alteromonas sp. M12 TaxID=3135644 RepID=UPI00319E8887
MLNTVNQLKGLRSELESALKLIENNSFTGTTSTSSNSKNLNVQLEQTDSLLARCEKIVNEKKGVQKPTLRIIHHFACSGGTLISKCLASMPNVYLLSEVHPLSQNHISSKPKYLPTDITTLARYAKIPNVDVLAEKLFVNNIREAEAFVREGGGQLVLREHTHIDFCLGDMASSCSVVDDCLKAHFNLKHLVTVRNPIDSYLSLMVNGWVQFSPNTFDEYCKRLIEFIKQYPAKNVLRYEDFVQNPDKQMHKICKLLELNFDERYRDIFSIFTVTGDSGRKSDDIALRPRREIDKSFSNEIKRSKNFKLVSKMLNYKDKV